MGTVTAAKKHTVWVRSSALSEFVAFAVTDEDPTELALWDIAQKMYGQENVRFTSAQ